MWTRDNSAAMRTALQDTHHRCAGRAERRSWREAVVGLKRRVDGFATALIIMLIEGARAWSALRLLSPETRTRIVVGLLFAARVLLNWIVLVVVFVIPFVTVVALYDILCAVDLQHAFAAVYDTFLAI